MSGTPKTLQQRWRAWERSWRADWAHDLSAPGARARARFDMIAFDHGFLRTLYSNTAQIRPGVFRANQPSPARLHYWAKRGLKTVINLRGASDLGSFLLEEEAARDLGLTLINVRLFSRQAPPRDAILELLDVYDRAETPMLLHCKSGADRAGLGAAIYVLSQGGTVPEALAQLSLRFMHVRTAHTGILTHFIEVYARAQAQSGIGFRDWVTKQYDEAEVTNSFQPEGISAWVVDRVLRRE
ncbi:MAG: sulfur transferase domain-containing protein [Pseudomonadota bacterium]